MRQNHPTRTILLLFALTLATGFLSTLSDTDSFLIPDPLPHHEMQDAAQSPNRDSTATPSRALLEHPVPTHPKASEPGVAQNNPPPQSQPRPTSPPPDAPRNPEQLLKSLVHLGATDQLGTARCFILFQQLALTLREWPGASGALEPLLVDPGTSPALRGLLLESLALANTGPARQILHQTLLQPEQDLSLPRATLRALIALEQPHPDTLHALGRLLEETQNRELALSTLDTLGRLAGKFPPSDHQLTGWVAEIFETYLAGAHQLTTKLQVLEMLGESGAPALQKALLEAASSEHPDLRKTALTSLARYPTPQSSHLFAESLRTDPSESIRALAAGALGCLQTPEAEQILLEALSSESHVGVRLALLDALTPLIDRPAVRQQIEQVARKTSDPDLQHLARRLLEISQVRSDRRG